MPRPILPTATGTGQTAPEVDAAIAAALVAAPGPYVPKTQTRNGVQAAPAIHILENGASGQPLVNLQDVAAHNSHLLQLQHFGDGNGSTVQTYGLNILNWPGARAAIVVHQYSNVHPGLWLDNTDNQPMIRIHNTHNATNNPLGPPTSLGDFLQMMTEGVTGLRLTEGYVWVASAGKTFTVLTSDAATKGMSVQTASTVETTTLEVIKAGTGAGLGVSVTNAGTGAGVTINQNGAGYGLKIVAGAGSAGIYPISVSALDYGAQIQTTTDGGIGLSLIKSSAGAGNVLAVANAGTGVGVSITQNGVGTGLALIQNGAQVGVSISQGVGGAGFYSIVATGQNYGPKFSTSTDGGQTVTVEKNAPAAGTALYLVNKGTGLSLDVRSAAASLFAITAAGVPQWVAAANQQLTVGAAGAAAALPATPAKFLHVRDSAGTLLVVPAYAAA